MGNSQAQRLQHTSFTRRSNSLETIFGDARKLTDYIVYLKTSKNDQAIRTLRQLELEVHLQPNSPKLRSWLDFLDETWNDYEQAATSYGNFEDTTEWAPHDLPKDDVLAGIRQTRPNTTETDQLHRFALSAMIGIHVATACSDIIERTGDAMEMRSLLYGFVDGELQALIGKSLSACKRTFLIPPQGSAYSPKTVFKSEYKITEFAPFLFREVRRLSGVSKQDYLASLCRTDFDYIPFGNNSKSGEVFFFSHDSRFLLKTVQASEAAMLLDMLPDVLRRIKDEERSLLGRYCGLYLVELEGVKRLFFVMKAVGAGGLPIHRTFDMKGSTRNRLAKAEETVGKDLNFYKDLGGLAVTDKDAEEIQRIHQGDARLLRKYGIMDYSLLVRMHDHAAGCGGLKGSGSGNAAMLRKGVAPTQLWQVSATNNPAIAILRQASVRCEEHHHAEIEFSGEDFPACNGSKDTATCAWLSRSGSSMYYLGIVDMLVSYTCYPQAQYCFTNIITCCQGNTASRVPPSFYYSRQVRMVKGLTQRNQVMRC